MTARMVALTTAVVSALLLGGALYVRTAGADQPGAIVLPPTNIAGTDLVVKQVVLKRTGTGEFKTYSWEITIRNQGAKASGASTTAVYWSTNANAAASNGVMGTIATPAVPAGGNVVVTITRQMAPFGSMTFIAYADAPISGKPLGVVGENSGLVLAGATYAEELNNAFGFPYNSEVALPQTYVNPNVK